MNDDCYCEYCSEPAPQYERSRVEVSLVKGSIAEVIYLFCNKECADKWMNR